MKLLNIFTVVAVTPGFAWPSSSHSEPAHYHGWAPAGPNDVRAPCPMLNTLANHGYLPHSGKAITENDTVNALYTALNINQTLGEFLFSAALTTNPAPNATTFDLDDLDRHDILEHDASLRSVKFVAGEGGIIVQPLIPQLSTALLHCFLVRSQGDRNAFYAQRLT